LIDLLKSVDDISYGVGFASVRSAAAGGATFLILPRIDGFSIFRLLLLFFLQ
jgi:hypothetical protein